MSNYQGKVNGIDVQAVPGHRLRCQAFINIDSSTYIQITTYFLNLQSLLELASLKDVEVEITYDTIDGENILTRIRVLDR